MCTSTTDLIASLKFCTQIEYRAKSKKEKMSLSRTLWSSLHMCLISYTCLGSKAGR
uniref:Uncharacterized protein n=1 Tax=Anguilla anguilla TaxID=7936 RepID=A0A0E9QWB9_ANGAN